MVKRFDSSKYGSNFVILWCSIIVNLSSRIDYGQRISNQKREVLEKETDQKNSVAVMSTAHNELPTSLNKEEIKIRFSPCTKACRQGPVDYSLRLLDSQKPKTGFQFSFEARSDSFSAGLRIKFKFYSLKDVFLKIKRLRIILNQENQLLQRIDQVRQPSDGQDHLIIQIGFV